MIDPVIFSFKLFGGLVITLRWYGVLVMLGAVVGAWIAEKEIKRRGENGEAIWDALIWVLPAGIIGARLWYVMNSILGGSTYYTDNPIKIFYIPEGGLHFFGGLLFVGIALLIFLRQKKMDVWLFLDAIGPVTMIGQAIARPANFINQELYGPPTKLPWGIPIDATHRIASYSDLGLFPVETTRFHPTFAYEMIWNFLAALFLIWYSRQYEEKIKPGTIFGGWLILAGIGRVIIEFFRPDQPRIPGTIITYSALVSALMAVAGVIVLLVRYGKIHFAFAEGWEDEYQIAESDPSANKPALVVADDGDDNEEEDDEDEIEQPDEEKPIIRRKTVSKTKTTPRSSRTPK
jgi:phosphatidylglycerol:prolipoprotein diacylglycerol transferase